MADLHLFSPCSPPASPSLPPSQLAAAAVNLGLFSSVSFSTPQKSSHRHPLCFLTASSPSLLHPRPAASTAFSFDAVLCCRHGLEVAVSPPSSSALISTPSSVLASVAFSEHSRHRDLLPSLLSLSSFVSAAEAVNLLLLCCRASSLLPLPSAAVVVPSPWLRSPPSPLCASPESLTVFLFLPRRYHLPFLHLLRHRQMPPSSSSTVRRPQPPQVHPLGNPPCSSAE